MKKNWLPLALVFLAGCGGHQNEAASSGPGAAPAAAVEQSAAAAPAPAQGEVTDEKIGLPAYPGSTEVEFSRLKMHSEVGDSFNVSYLTTDSPAQVAAFYQAEAAKVGTLQETLPSNEFLKSVSVNRTDGTQSAIQARSDGKGKTLVSVHRFFPAK